MKIMETARTYSTCRVRTNLYILDDSLEMEVAYAYGTSQ